MYTILNKQLLSGQRVEKKYLKYKNITCKCSKSRTFILKCSNFVEFSYEDKEDISNFSCHIRPISCIFHPYQTLTKRKKDSGEFQGKLNFSDHFYVSPEKTKTCQPF